MAEKKETNVKTEVKDGATIVMKTTIVTSSGCSENLRNLKDLKDIQKIGAFPDKSIAEKPTAAPTKDEFQKKSLERHNHHRKKHGVPQLEWCSKCASKAQAHADKMASSGNFSHSNEKGFGENLYSAGSSSGADISADKAVDAWYDEIKDMKFGEAMPSNLSKVGHFTQVVWKETTHMGMAYATKGNSVFVVANYLPPGNFLGKFKENVLPAK